MGTLMTWQDLSEIAFGLLLNGSEPITKYSAELFSEPYSSGFSNWKEKGDQTALAKIIGTPAINAALAAADTVSEDSEVDYSKLLTASRNKFLVGVAAEKAGKRLREGRDVDVTVLMELSSAMKNLSNPESTGLSDIGDEDITNWEPFQETGWDALDKTVGGISSHRPTIVGATTGSGKTMWTLQFLEYYLERWPEKKVAVYSLEMSRAAWKSRAVKLFPKLCNFFNTGRLLVSDTSVTATDVQLEMAAEGVDLGIIDYINYLVKGEITPQSIEVVNRQMNEICRTLGIPLIVLHQYNAQRANPVPNLSYFYMGTSTSNTAGLVIALGSFRNAEEPGNTFVFDEDRPMFMYFLKSGDGFMFERGPGAAFMPRTKNLWGSSDFVWQVADEQAVSIKKRKRNDD